jgi:hypothetical protein
MEKSMDMQYLHVAWHAAWSSGIDAAYMQLGHAAKACSMDRQH